MGSILRQLPHATVLKLDIVTGVALSLDRSLWLAHPCHQLDDCALRPVKGPLCCAAVDPEAVLLAGH